MAQLGFQRHSRRTQKIKTFSDWEIDVAKQLLQLSREYKAIADQLANIQSPNKNPTNTNRNKFDLSKKISSSDSGGDTLLLIDRSKEDDRESNDAATVVFEGVFDDEEDDGYPKRWKKRMRSIQRIYESTEPLIVFSPKRIKQS